MGVCMRVLIPLLALAGAAWYGRVLWKAHKRGEFRGPNAPGNSRGKQSDYVGDCGDHDYS